MFLKVQYVKIDFNKLLFVCFFFGFFFCFFLLVHKLLVVIKKCYYFTLFGNKYIAFLLVTYTKSSSGTPGECRDSTESESSPSLDRWDCTDWDDRDACDAGSAWDGWDICDGWHIWDGWDGCDIGFGANPYNDSYCNIQEKDIFMTKVDIWAHLTSCWTYF